MAIKTKTMNLNLLCTVSRNKMPWEAFDVLVKKFVSEKHSNHYSKTTFEILENLFVQEEANKKLAENKAIRYLTSAFNEFLEYLSSRREVSYHNNEQTKVTVCHDPYKNVYFV